MQAIAIEGGFTDGPVQASEAFRQIMNALARPGTICTLGGAIAPAPLSVAASTVVLTLCDHETPIFLADGFDTPDVRQWIAFHTGSPIVGPRKAAFALGHWDSLPLEQFPIGTPEYPDRSTTVIVEQAVLVAQRATLSGPGIKTKAALSLPELAAFQRNALLFPLGLDFFFTQGSQIAGLPRTTKVT